LSGHVRLYKFYSADRALQNLEQGRLKVSLRRELNDPFEMFHFQLPDARQRLAWERTVDEVWRDKGLICFSRRWSNPVIWSHYSESHTGLCLGVDVPKEFAFKVNYVRRRPKVDLTSLSSDERLSAIEAFTYTKFMHWKYEEEFRMFLSLTECVEDNGMFFLNLGDQVKLREIVIGANSRTRSADIWKFVGNDIEITTARLAFRTFNVCKQRNKTLQI
jgi:hypothetical protein